MGNWYTLIGFFVVMLVTMLLLSGKSRGLISRLFAIPRMTGRVVPHRKLTAEKLKANANREKERTKELDAILKAKRELMKIKAGNTTLRKKIEGTTERSVVESEKSPSEMDKPKRRSLSG